MKLYGDAPEGQKRYSPAECIGCRKTPIEGRPDKSHVSTSFVERQNLTMRMCMRRFTRLTNGFSKKLENHEHALALYFTYYNFVRIHKTLKVTPAMAAGVTTELLEMADLVTITDEYVAKQESDKRKGGRGHKYGVGVYVIYPINYAFGPLPRQPIRKPGVILIRHSLAF